MGMGDEELNPRPEVSKDWLPNYVAEWEAREQQFRKTLENYKKEVDRRYGVLISGLSEDLAKKQDQLLRIREIPLVGRLILWYTSR